MRVVNQRNISNDHTGLAKLIGPGGRMGLLLMTLVMWIVFGPFLSNVVLLSAFMIFVILAAVATVATTRRSIILAILLGVAPFILSTMSVAGYVRADPLRNFLILLFFVYIISLMLRHIIAVRVVGPEIMYAAVACYLLIGILLMMVHIMIDNYMPGSYSASSGVPLESYDFLYFSLVTLTTLGYGDITPTTQFAKGISVLEAVIGVFYIGLIISRLVSLGKGDVRVTAA